MSDLVVNHEDRYSHDMALIISAVKNKNVVILEVDDFEPITTTSSGTATSADTKNPIYIGGKPGRFYNKI